MGESRKPAATARHSARAKAAEKMAERKKREKLIADELESFFGADLVIGEAEKTRDDAIAKAQDTYLATVTHARDEKAVHARSLKKLGLTDREISDLVEQPVSAVRDLLRLTKTESDPKNDSDSTENSGTPDSDSTRSEDSSDSRIAS